MERWLPIPEFEGLYEVSDHGRVRRVGVRGGLLACTVSLPGYPLAQLWKGGKQYSRRVHALVLTAFVAPCPPKHVARHWPDNNKLNNRLDNLSWATPRRNMQDKKYFAVTRPWKLTPKQVKEIRCAVALGEVQRHIARRYNISPCTISDILFGRTHCDV